MSTIFCSVILWYKYVFWKGIFSLAIIGYRKNIYILFFVRVLFPNFFIMPAPKKAAKKVAPKKVVKKAVAKKAAPKKAAPKKVVAKKAAPKKVVKKAVAKKAAPKKK